MGACRAAHLSLTPHDHPMLGIRSMEDRVHLYNLLQFVKSLDLENPQYDQEKRKKRFNREVQEKSSSSEYFNQGLQFSHWEEKPGCSKIYQPGLYGMYNNNQPDVHHHLYSKQGSMDGSSTPGKSGKSPIQYRRRILWKQGAVTKYHIKMTSESHPPLVHKSPPTSGYNYGLPHAVPIVNKRTGEPRIRVCVRKKPLPYKESQKGERDVVTVANGGCVIVHESKEAFDSTQYLQQHKFYFNHVFGDGSTNKDVYLKTAYPLVQHTLSGGQSTCFAYGQTGAGKTHTMLGSTSGVPGLYSLAARDIFAHLSTLQASRPLMVYVSFFEIYCGRLYDLLDHRKRLFSREDGEHVVHIAGLAQVRVDSEDSLLQVITHGTKSRTQGESGVNNQSSRSHALLQIQLRRPNHQTEGRIWFVDLAGSERARDSKDPNKRSRREGAEINQSLLALKECIRSLDQQLSHTPFRQSKLTQVLKDSFVGDAMTCMIANISPGESATEPTLNTLRYADRVKELKRRKVRRGQTVQRNAGSLENPLRREGWKTERQYGIKEESQDAYKTEEEKQQHLRWYHQQLQQFVPSSSTSCSAHSSLSSSLSSSGRPSSCRKDKAMDCDEIVSFNGQNDDKQRSEEHPRALWKEVQVRFGVDRDVHMNGKSLGKEAGITCRDAEKEKERWTYDLSDTCVSQDNHAVPSSTNKSISSHTVQQPYPAASSSLQALSKSQPKTKTLQKQEQSPRVGGDNTWTWFRHTPVTQDVCESDAEKIMRSQRRVPESSSGCLLQTSLTSTDAEATQYCSSSNHQLCPGISATTSHMNHSLETNLDNQEKKLRYVPTMDRAQWRIVQAHVMQLKEMEILCHSEEKLLSQQENMSFQLYVEKLEEIMKRKALCVHDIRYKLQPYL